MKTKLIILSLFLISTLSINAQSDLTIKSGEMLIRFENESDFTAFQYENRDLNYIKPVSKALQLYLYEFNPFRLNIDQITEKLNNHPLILAAGPNFQVEKRITTPDDTFFGDQDYLDIINAPDAWDISTSAPPELVVAIVEGADIEHQDLRENIWTNPNEIDNDGIDNDDNGYIDDFFGVNVSTGTDDPVVDDHGVAVAGIVGAKGDNAMGVTGVIWDVKMMIVSSNLTFLDIVASYDYIYNMRKKYNETNGEEGAYIVCTNSSFGVNNAFINQNPIYQTWCDAYDLMGSVGIVSVAATNNALVNIELNGDMPGLCPSEYLIIVTDTNLNDELEAGFGKNAVDLSAPGTCFTTDLNDDYEIFSGTSAAAPVVSGSIALMYSYPCEDLQIQAMAFPDSTALLMKNILLSNVDQVLDLEDKTVSGGRLNLFNAMRGVIGEFGAPQGSLGFINLYPNPVHDLLKVEYQTFDVSDYELKVYDALGRLVYYHFIPEFCAPRVIEIPVLNLAAGTYFISIENNNNISSSRFVVY